MIDLKTSIPVSEKAKKEAFRLFSEKKEGAAGFIEEMKQEAAKREDWDFFDFLLETKIALDAI